MKFIALAAAAALIATPALAQTNAGFTGARAELTAGINDITGGFDRNEVVYGAEVGVDAPLGDKFTLGVAATATNVFEQSRQVGASARLGYAYNPKTLFYAQGGYNNYQDTFSRSLDGFVVGAGIERKISERTYVKAQYNYSDFERNQGSHSGLVGVGIRF